MEEEGESTTPFWLQSSATRRRLSSGVLLFTLSLTFSFLIFFLISLSSHITKPNLFKKTLFKKTWDSLNITLVLLALIFAFLSRNRTHEFDESQVEKSNESVLRRDWFEFPDSRSNENHDPTRNVVKNRDSVIGLKRTHSSYPDLREIAPNDTSLNAYTWRGKSSPEEESKTSVYIDEVNTGTVVGVGEGIARVRGLDGVTAGEIVEFDEGIIGIVTNSEYTENVGVLLMGDGLRVPEGSCVKATGKIAHVPVSLGRGVDVSAKLIDGGDEIKEMHPAIRRRTRRIAGSEGKLSEEVSGMEPPSGRISHRRTKSSGLEPSGEKLSHGKTKSSCGFEGFGTVLLVGDGIARIYGLDEVTEGEIVEFEEGTIGIVMNSESANNVGVVLLGDGLLIQEGSRVKATGKIAQIPVPKARLGSVINSLAKPIDDKGEISASESRLVEKRESKPGVRRRARRTSGSKPSEEVNGLEELSRRKTKRTHEEIIVPKVETKDELEPNEYKSSPEILVQNAPLSSPPRSEKKSATRDFLSSLGKTKKKQKQKSVENFDTSPEHQPPSPTHPSKSFFSSKKGKSKNFVTVPPPPPLAESPLHPIPLPPPPPPFKMPSWKFVMKGDYVKVGSVNSSRSVSPEPEEVRSPVSSESGGGADVAMFCPSPDVNSKADMFIAKFRAGLKLQKMNSMKQKQGVGLSNLGPVSTMDQAQA